MCHEELELEPRLKVFQAPVRDGFRCVATGFYDHEAYDEESIDQNDLRVVGIVETECAHILPTPTFSYLRGTGDKSLKVCRYICCERDCRLCL